MPPSELSEHVKSHCKQLPHPQLKVTPIRNPSPSANISKPQEKVAPMQASVGLKSVKIVATKATSGELLRNYNN
jgi:hypothetical protein